MQELANYLEKLKMKKALTNVRTNIGIAIKDTREDWIIQGHFGSTWQDGQYVRTREMDKVIPAFEDFMERLQIDYLDFGMIHYVDEVEDFENIMNGEFIKYVRQQKEYGVIRHIGISTHSPTVALLATEVEDIELIMFSINPAFDMLASINDIAVYIEDDTYKNKELEGLAPERAELYQVCKDKDIPLVVMKGYAGGRLLRDDLTQSKKVNSLSCLQMFLMHCKQLTDHIKWF